MKKIRKSVFETNSSSTHSISISDSGKINPNSLFVDNGICKIYTRDFGWEEKVYYDTPTKAAYCLTYIKNYNCKYILKEMLIKVIKEVTGANKVVFVKSNSKYNPWGYIDHQSLEVCEEVFNSEEDLKSFIFNENSFLKTDNDNH